jgi:hypothetical protein
VKGIPLPSALPTAQPAFYAPTTTYTSTAFQLNVNTVVVTTILTASAMTVFSVIAFYSRKEEGLLHPFSLLFTMFQLTVLPVLSFLKYYSLLYYLILRSSQYNVRYGYAWVSIRALFIAI